MEKRNANQARILGVIEAKRLIIAASLAGTLSLWYVFANQANKNAAAVTATAVPTTSTQDSSAASGPVIDFPPLPTLVPTLQVTLGKTILQAAPTQPSDLTQAPVVQAAAPARIVVAGARPPSKAAPAPVARSRSSR